MANGTVIMAAAGGAVIGGLVGYFIKPEPAPQPKIVVIHVSPQLLAFIATIHTAPTDVDYADKYDPLFDVNKDGAIDIYDEIWFSQHAGTWVTLTWG